MKAKKYSLDPDALIRSLHTALVTREDFDSSRTRLLNAINRLPEGSLQIFRQPNKVLFYWRIIETEDPQVRDRASLADIIKTRILPYLWF